MKKKAPCMLCGINTRSKRGVHGKCMKEYWDNVQMGMKKALIRSYQAYNEQRKREAREAAASGMIGFAVDDAYIQPGQSFYITDVQCTGPQTACSSKFGELSPDNLEELYAQIPPNYFKTDQYPTAAEIRALNENA